MTWRDARQVESAGYSLTFYNPRHLRRRRRRKERVSATARYQSYTRLGREARVTEYLHRSEIGTGQEPSWSGFRRAFDRTRSASTWKQDH